MKRGRLFTVRLSDAEREQLRELAARHGLSSSSYPRMRLKLLHDGLAAAGLVPPVKK